MVLAAVPEAAAVGIEHNRCGRIIGKRCGMSRNLARPVL